MNVYSKKPAEPQLEPERPRRLAWPRTSPFHGGNAGSNPAGDAKQDKEVVEVCSGIPKRLKILIPITHQLCVL